MNETLKKILDQLKAFYQSLSPARRASFVAIIALTLLAFTAIAFFLTRDDYQPLVSGLSAEDTKSVSALLRDRSIPTRVAADGTRISVPADKLDEARLEMASAGLPQGGGVGYELFDKSELGMTAFREQVNYRRALEGELSRTIRSLAEVRSARVHIVLPQKALFKEDQEQPSASVVVNLQPGHTLGPQQIKGVRYLVSSAIEGMLPERVTLLDGKGAVLARVGDGDEVAVDGARVEYQRFVERRLEQRIRHLLEPLVGAGRVVAQVTATVDYKRVVETSELYDPERTVVRSEQRSSERRTGEGRAASGVAGARSNLPGGPTAGQASTDNRYERNSELVNYEVDKRVLQTEYPQGAIRRVSVAVVVDGTVRKEGEGEDAKPVYQPRGAEEMARLTNLVKKAVGFDPERGDQVEVSNVAFEVPETPAASTFAWVSDLDLGGVMRVVGLVALALILLLLVVRPAMRAIAPRGPEVILPPGRTATVAELERRLLSEKGMDKNLLEAGEEDSVTVIRRLARENPSRVVQVIRGWLQGASHE